MPSTVAHELTHHLQYFLEPEEYGALLKQYRTEKSKVPRLVARQIAVDGRRLNEVDYRSFEEWWATTIENGYIFGKFMKELASDDASPLWKAAKKSAVQLRAWLEAAHRYYLRSGMPDHASIIEGRLRGAKDRKYNPFGIGHWMHDEDSELEWYLQIQEDGMIHFDRHPPRGKQGVSNWRKSTGSSWITDILEEIFHR